MNRANELNHFFKDTLQWNKTRISFLVKILQALITMRTVNLTELAQAFCSKAKTESSYRRIQRFLSGFAFDPTLIIPLLLKLFSLSEKQLVLAIDRTHWKWGRRHINILLVSIVYGKTALPIYWKVSPAAGNSSTDSRKQAFAQILKRIGAKNIALLLADREFIGEKWFLFLIRKKIPFIIRAKKNTRAGGICPGEQVALVRLEKNNQKNFPVLVGGHYLYASISRAKSAEEPIIVLSNRQWDDPISLYLKRWGIETLFGYLKSKGFRLEETHITDPKRIERLLFVLALAFSWSFKVGLVQTDWAKPLKKKHGRFAKSIFRTGLDRLRRILLAVNEHWEAFLEMIDILIFFKLRSYCEV